MERPANSPCVTWQHQQSCWCGAQTPGGWTGMNETAFVPSIYTAWRWFPNGTPSTGLNSYCAACLTPPSEHEFHCAFEFPCYVSGQGWGHHHVSSSVHFCVKNGCNVHLPSGAAGGSCGSTCDDPGDDGPPCTNASKALGMWLPLKGPEWQKFGWQVAQSGSRPVKAHGQLITDPSGQFVLARAAAAIPFPNCGAGTTGWVQLASDGTLGCMKYTANIVSMEMCNGFEVAYCAACAPCPHVVNASVHSGSGCPNCTRPSGPTPPPPLPPPPTPPPAPPGGSPCIRFGNTIPSSNVIDATVTQGDTSHTWSKYRFSQFSDWLNIFSAGAGQITVKDHSSGKILLTATIPLTPGPLLVVVKDFWPPRAAKNVETIAASFSPPKAGSAVRLFNLAPDVLSADLLLGSSSGKLLAHAVKYSLGSPWTPVSCSQTTFTTVAGRAESGVVVPHIGPAKLFSLQVNATPTLASAVFTPPNAPAAFTVFLLGSKTFGYSLLPQVDAPETGPCKPTS